MPYLGNTPTTQSFISGTDYFNGTGSQTAFTLTRTVASVNDIQAVVNNVVQVPSDAYTISGTTITFTSAPSAGTSNVYVRYLSTTTQVIAPSQGTVGTSQLGTITNIASGNTALTLQTGSTPTTAVTINASQNVGIGTSSPSTKLHVEQSTTGDAFKVARGGNYIIMGGSGSGTQYIKGYEGVVAFGNEFAGATTFLTNNTERMRIDSSGMVNVGTGGNGEIYVGRNTTIANAKLEVTGSANMLVTNNTDTGVGAINVLYVVRNNNNVGTIQCTNIATSFNTSSDYRLKENIAPMTGALATVAQLKPVTYKWKIDGSDGQGFIAHELAEVVPDCVSGEKDAVETYTDEEGNEQTRIKAQGIDTSFLVATLTAAIQELNAKVDAQATTIAELQARLPAITEGNETNSASLNEENT